LDGLGGELNREAGLACAAGEALGRIAGLAPSPVLAARLARATHLLPACFEGPEHNEAPGWAALLDAVTVQETRLFRDPQQCLAVSQRLPVLAAEARAAGRPLRLLSAGCATGEEAFTLAAMAEEARLAVPGLAAEVLGLDLCRPALRQASEGVIAPGLGDPLEHVPEPQRHWFAGIGGAPALHPRLAALLRFRRANLLDGLDAEPPFDVVMCRNVLIYMTDEARERVLRHLLAALRPRGLLALGPSDRPPPGVERLAEGVLRGRDA
jgi:chemotaxis protein methyltransferase CheR